MFGNAVKNRIAVSVDQVDAALRNREGLEHLSEDNIAGLLTTAGMNLKFGQVMRMCLISGPRNTYGFATATLVCECEDGAKLPTVFSWDSHLNTGPHITTLNSALVDIRKQNLFRISLKRKSDAELVMRSFSGVYDNLQMSQIVYEIKHRQNTKLRMSVNLEWAYGSEET